MTVRKENGSNACLVECVDKETGQPKFFHKMNDEGKVLFSMESEEGIDLDEFLKHHKFDYKNSVELDENDPLYKTVVSHIDLDRYE